MRRGGEREKEKERERETLTSFNSPAKSLVDTDSLLLPFMREATISSHNIISCTHTIQYMYMYIIHVAFLNSCKGAALNVVMILGSLIST